MIIKLAILNRTGLSHHVMTLLSDTVTTSEIAITYCYEIVYNLVRQALSNLEIKITFIEKRKKSVLCNVRVLRANSFKNVSRIIDRGIN